MSDHRQQFRRLIRLLPLLPPPACRSWFSIIIVSSAKIYQVSSNQLQLNIINLVIDSYQSNKNIPLVAVRFEPGTL